MISRRVFLKVSGLAAAALSTGYGAGKLTVKNRNTFFSVTGFIPADENILRQLISSFTAKVNPSPDAIIFADSRYASIINEVYNQCRTGNESGSVKIRLSKVNAPVMSDILISEGDASVINPELFNSAFAGIRSRIQNKKAEYFITAEFHEKNMFASLFNSNKKVAVIENQYGTVDKISLSNTFKDIIIPGAFGKTNITLQNGSIGITKVSCRNQICRHSGYIRESGETIACAPNKLIIKIETV